jgi:hypothetical protein
VNLVAVSVDPAEGPDVLRTYRQAGGYPWTFAVGDPQLIQRFGVHTTMSRFSVDRRGTILYKGKHQAEDARAWEQMFERLV